MKKSILVSLATAVVVVVPLLVDPGCNAQEANAVVKDITPAGACIAGELIAGVTDPVAILGVCVSTTIDDIIAVIESIYAASVTDAGADAGASNLAVLSLAHAKAVAYKAAH
jgi:hypothetical protein